FISVKSQLLVPGALKTARAEFPNVPLAGIVNAEVSNHRAAVRCPLGSTPSPIRFGRTELLPIWAISPVTVGVKAWPVENVETPATCQPPTRPPNTPETPERKRRSRPNGSCYE